MIIICKHLQVYISPGAQRIIACIHLAKLYIGQSVFEYFLVFFKFLPHDACVCIPLYTIKHFIWNRAEPMKHY